MNHSFHGSRRSIIYPREIDPLRENRWLGFGKGLKKDLNGRGGRRDPLISVMKFLLEGGTMPGIIFGPVPTVLSIAASLSLVGGTRPISLHRNLIGRAIPLFTLRGK